MRKAVYALGGLVLLTAASGCMSMGAAIAPSTTPITDSMTVTQIGPASGSSWGFMLFGIPLSEAGHRKAVQRALASSGADALIEVVSDNKMYYLFIITLYQVRVEGTAVKLSRRPS